MYRFRASMAILIWLPALVGLAADSQADRREKLETAVPEGIRLLEAKDYVAFLKNFASPEDLKKFTEKTPLDEFAKEFGLEKAPRLLEVLKSIRDVKPTLELDGTKATYALKEPIGGKKVIIWVKIGKYWYIHN